MTAIVDTRSGRVLGELHSDVFAFRGVPYAASLDGRRRFQQPGRVADWDGVRDCRQFGVAVPQPQGWSEGDDPESLTVNVWTPDLQGARLPVMVWIHGGLFLGGTANSPDFDGTALARRGIVCVTVNYRVGYEGFGWVSDAPSNRGVLDQIAALGWVQDNIEAFGGDPGAVTVFGQSAGASSILAMLTGQVSDGILHRAIAQSPGNIFVPVDEARAVSTMITSELGIEPTVEALSQTPASDFHRVQMNPVVTMASAPESWTLPHSPYSLILDEHLLQAPPWIAVSKSRYAQMPPLVCGYTTDEAQLFTATSDLGGTALESTARGVGLPSEAVSDYRAAYPGSDEFLHGLMLSDSLFRMPATWTAEAMADVGASTYLYEFAWPSPGHPDTLGACHGLDVPLTFQTARGQLSSELIGTDVPDDFFVLSDSIQHAWVEFARSSNPGWPGFDTTRRTTRLWHTPPALQADPIGPSRSIWNKHHGPQRWAPAQRHG